MRTSFSRAALVGAAAVVAATGAAAQNGFQFKPGVQRVVPNGVVREGVPAQRETPCAAGQVCAQGQFQREGVVSNPNGGVIFNNGHTRPDARIDVM